jgi:hypothetical protein
VWRPLILIKQIRNVSDAQNSAALALWIWPIRPKYAKNALTVPISIKAAENAGFSAIQLRCSTSQHIPARGVIPILSLTLTTSPVNHALKTAHPANTTSPLEE